MKTRLEAKVTGTVQGVMFRDFTQRHSRALDLKGFVQNDPDGSVNVVAEGEEKNINKLVEKLKKGPLLTSIRCRVENVDVNYFEPTNEFDGFEIRY